MGIMQDWGEAQVGRVFDVLTEGFDEETQCWFGRSYADAPEIDGRVYFTAADVPAPGTVCAGAYHRMYGLRPDGRSGIARPVEVSI